MKRILPMLALLMAAPASAQHSHPEPAAGGWTDLPLVVAQAKGRAGAEIRPVNLAAAEVTVTPPKGVPVAAAVEGGKAAFKPETGNYHLVGAVEACDSHVATAATALYFSNPGPAPTAILTQTIQGLAVLPERLPREHAAYRAGTTWRFRVTFDGQPFPGAKVRVETANGTRTEMVAGLDGEVDVTFPEDFAPFDQRPPEAHGRPPEAQFVVAAISATGAVRHVGAFNHVYRPNPFDGTSLWAGAGFALAGMAGAAPLLRRRKGGRP